MNRRNLIVAAAQMECAPGARSKNLAKASRLAEEAASRGAELVLFPEMMPGGYLLTEAIWETAEPFNGPTVNWMKALSARLGVYLGTTFLEAQGEDFFNTFVLTDPNGVVLGRIRKSPPASFEAYFFTSGSDQHWIDTPLGRVGVGICFENALYERYCELHEADIDLYLRPFSGAAFEAKFPVGKRDAEQLNAALRDGTAETAKLMGIPVVMANKVGRLKTALPAGFPSQNIEFPGLSAVADGDGSLRQQLGAGREGVVVGEITIDSARKSKGRQPPLHGRWTAPLPWVLARLWLFTQWLGERAYAKSARRRVKAKQMAIASDA